MKTNFLVITAHEVRTPLTLLKGYVEVLLEGFLGAVSEAQRDSLGVCRRSLNRLIATFNQILDMVRLEEKLLRLTLSPTDLPAVAREVISELAPFIERRRQRVTVDAAGPVAPLAADGEKLRVVLVNLIGNAIKFTPDGGHIRVSLAGEATGLSLVVEDSGIGLDSTEIPRIFDKFYTGPEPMHHTSGTYQFKAGGAGLGLAIAKGYVEAHGGRIWAESDGPGKGSRFHVTIPCAARASDGAPAPHTRVADEATAGPPAS
jgi:signal transduction histidine kinase